MNKCLKNIRLGDSILFKRSGKIAEAIIAGHYDQITVKIRFGEYFVRRYYLLGSKERGFLSHNKYHYDPNTYFEPVSSMCNSFELIELTKPVGLIVKIIKSKISYPIISKYPEYEVLY